QTTQQSLARAVYKRRDEYTVPKEVRIKVGTWNVASLKGTEKDIQGWFVQGKGIAEKLSGLDIPEEVQDERESVEAQEARASKRQATIPRHDAKIIPGDKDIGLYVLGLQEVVDVTSPSEALKPYTDPAAANKFKSSLSAALPPGYELIAEQQLIGLLLLIYASPAVAKDVKSVSTTSVGTGVMGYMGNKGAVTARLVLGETTRLVFVDCHLGAGVDKGAVERRNWDAGQILSRTKFEPIKDSMDLNQTSGEQIGDEDFAFWFGDLNYRLEGIPGDDIRRLLMLHTRDEYDTNRAATAANIDKELEDNPPDLKIEENVSHDTSSSDLKPPPSEEANPASLQTTLASLLPHDELHQQMKARKAFHDGWKEAPIHFLPTYKYDVGSVGVFDSGEKRRAPSWCDRILYRTRATMLDHHQKAEAEAQAKVRDEELRKSGVEEAAEDESVLYEYNEDEDGDEYDEAADADPEVITTKEGLEAEITQEYYTAHQRVLSSDHKPISAVFILKYDSVIPELKAKVHAEVVRNLDRNENETRPTITLIVDPTPREASGADTPNTEDLGLQSVNFGRVRFGQHKRKHVTIANTGQVPASICFINRLGANGQVEPPVPIWIGVEFDRDPDIAANSKSKSKEPVTYTLQPGDACNITLTSRVDTMELARRLTDKSEILDDILILRVMGGRDHFMPVFGKFIQSGFEKTIEKVMQLPETSIRRLQNQ
ncbi:DNase I-like protein, partial [Tothia fuscella]